MSTPQTRIGLFDTQQQDLIISLIPELISREDTVALLSSLSSLICQLLQPYITATLFLIDLRNKAKKIREMERLRVSNNKPKKSLSLKPTNPSPSAPS